jgi:hypothetical protein
MVLQRAYTKWRLRIAAYHNHQARQLPAQPTVFGWQLGITALRDAYGGCNHYASMTRRRGGKLLRMLAH